MNDFKYDKIGYWSEIKLAIIKDYAGAYSTILASKPFLKHVYIDGFAGAGEHISKTTGEIVPGSPLNAIRVEPRFSEYHLIDLNPGKAINLRNLTADRSDVFVYEGDCNRVLIEEVYPRAQYSDYKRALCILDPYGLHLDWDVMFKAGQMKSVDMFLNFPIMDMNMNVLKKQIELVDERQAYRMTRFWGDESWRKATRSTHNLFELENKVDNLTVVRAFCNRLKVVAGFKYVIEPIPMRISTGATVYYLMFASANETGSKIAKAIFKKYKDRGKING